MSGVEKEVKREVKAAEKKLHKINVWMMTTIVLIIVLAGVLIFSGSASPAIGDKQEVADKAVQFINNNLVQSGTSASFVSVEEFEGLYNVTVSYQGNDISIFLTKDGESMFLSSPLNISQELPKAESTQQAAETPKTDKPTVQLFVMSFCPYGAQAEAAMRPVVDLLGSKADIKIRFIADVGGTTPDSVQSLHGAPEAEEDLRQICVMKYYDQKILWDYITAINNDCFNSYRNPTVYDPCWKNAATEAGIDVSKIDACSKGSEGVNLLKIDDELAAQYGVSGSPTLLINGARYNGARTPDAYKEAVCNAFNTPPAECSQQLSTTGTAASGNC